MKAGDGAHLGPIMALYFFRISNGRYAGASDQGSEFENREAAWAEMTKVSGNLLGSISRGLKPNAEWQMELLDESKKPVFRIRLVAESVG
jgi:lipid-binding SYLF domain-containing protein